MMSSSLLINPSKELFRWGPVPGRLFFMSEFNRTCFVTYPEHFSFGWPNTTLLFFDDRLLWINEVKTIEEMGKKVFLALVLPREHRKKLHQSYKNAVIHLRAFQTGMSAEQLQKLPDQSFLEAWKTFYDLLADFWLPTIPPELGNYGSGALLEDSLRNIVPAGEISHVMGILTAPEELSFYQEEEIELSESNDLVAHADKYHWLKNSYGYCERLPVSFFEKRKAELSAGLREKMELHVQEAKKKKEEIIAYYSLSEE
ncbi:MAG: hypothetical protein AAB448_00585, partial [Patescibacteria group bacterium]